MSANPEDLIRRLGGRISPDITETDPTRIRCVLCGTAPCSCVRCATHDMPQSMCRCDGS